MSKDPYVYDDTNVLKNLANIKEQHKLDDYETTMVNLGIIKLLKSDIEIVKVNDIIIQLKNLNLKLLKIFSLLFCLIWILIMTE